MNEKNIKILKMEYVSIIEAFPKEASNFTPWLSENIDRLNEVLSFEIMVHNTEVQQVDGYKADIVGSDEENNRVIIENQYYKTDHKHLGQLLIYAVTLEAKKVIWIVEKFRQGHIEVIEWLNEQTDKDFYIVEIKIGKVESGYIPIFNVIVRPSAESKKIGEYKKKLASKPYKHELTPIKQEIYDELKRHLETISESIKIEAFSGGYKIRNTQRIFCWLNLRKYGFLLSLDLHEEEMEGFILKVALYGKKYSRRQLHSLEDLEASKEAIKKAYEINI